MLDKVSAGLAALQPEGDFAAEVACSAGGLQIEVKGVGPIGLPVSARTAQRLCSVARLAPFGKRDKTLLDLRVRNTWEISGDQVMLDTSTWLRAIAPQLAKLRRSLGLPEDGEIVATFDKLLIYGPGQFFAPHKDSERADDMMASLVVQLPSECSGGDLVVRHQGRKKALGGGRRRAKGSKDVALLAFYADCLHEVRPVRSGYRVALTYQLHHRSATRGSQIQGPAVERLAREVGAYFATPVGRRFSSGAAQRPDRLVYLLDHEYTQKSLSFDRLKSGDRLRVSALLQVAERLGCEACLALADVHETWSCYEENDWDDYGRRGWRRSDEDEEGREDDELAEDSATGDYTLDELCESSIELRGFIGPDGRPQRGATMHPDDSEICFTTASEDMTPFKAEHEGYMGNYGNTVDRFYHRAALVMWPRDRQFVIRAKASPAWAATELGRSVKARRLDEARERARSLLPFWAGVAPSERGAAFFEKLLAIATAIGDAELARGLLTPLGPDRLSASSTPPFITLVERYGLPWAQQLFTDWDRSAGYGTPPWHAVLPELCRQLVARPGAQGGALAAWLLTREVASFRKAREASLRDAERWPASDAARLQDDVLLPLLEGAAVLGATAVRDELIEFLTTGKGSLTLMGAGALLRQCRKGRTPAAVSALGLQALHHHVVAGLERTLAAPLRSHDDWSIDPPMRCACGLCKELSGFLRDRARIEHAWPLAQDGRQHVHQMIDSYHLPVSHVTTRQGRPYTLVLKKLRKLFEIEAALRKEQEALLTWLKKEQAVNRPGITVPRGARGRSGAPRPSRSSRSVPSP
jgi:hypothetical protein